MTTEFDPLEKEAQLRRESQSWDTGTILPAQPGDIPVINIADYFRSGDPVSLDSCASQVRAACERVGFFSLVGHGFPEEQMAAMFDQVRKFHALSRGLKETLLMDRPGSVLPGAGYLPVKNRKLPTRDRGNLNEAFIVKRDHVASLEDNQWPTEAQLPGFRDCVQAYADAIEGISKQLVPVFARALDLDADYFSAAFSRPMYRLRMTRYPSILNQDVDEFGIAPHVDTTFFTILAQDSPGLVIYSETRKCWITAPVIDGAFIVNTGELLRQWTNDRFISVKHFANNNTSGSDRYSIPFFFNANADYPMECLPTCFGPGNPPRYPTISYLESQAAAQGE